MRTRNTRGQHRPYNYASNHLTLDARFTKVRREQLERLRSVLAGPEVRGSNEGFYRSTLPDGDTVMLQKPVFAVLRRVEQHTTEPDLYRVDVRLWAERTEYNDRGDRIGCTACPKDVIFSILEALDL